MLLAAFDQPDGNRCTVRWFQGDALRSHVALQTSSGRFRRHKMLLHHYQAFRDHDGTSVSAEDAKAGAPDPRPFYDGILEWRRIYAFLTERFPGRGNQ
ncbi:hypothetical protein GCM10022262_27490 [Georgenia daeguensis]|uniref:Uncharacterized protein n=1 Tax=Georgenia daeguensis TaxID=908355 RepID=A0ABP8EWL2_9MICO